MKLNESAKFLQNEWNFYFFWAFYQLEIIAYESINLILEHIKKYKKS